MKIKGTFISAILLSATALQGYGTIIPGIEVERANIPQELLNLELENEFDWITGSSSSRHYWWELKNGVQENLYVHKVDNYAIAAAGAHLEVSDKAENDFRFTTLTVIGADSQTYSLDNNEVKIEGTGSFSLSDYTLTLDFSENLTGAAREIILEITDNDNTYQLSFKQPDLKPYIYIGTVEYMEADNRMAFNELSDGTLSLYKVWGDYSSNENTCNIPYIACEVEPGINMDIRAMDIRAIEGDAFTTATGIKTLSLSDMLHHVDSNGFNGLELEHLWYMAAHETRPEWIIGFNETAFENAEIASQTFNDCVLHVDSRVYDRVKDAEGWCNFTNILSFANSSEVQPIIASDKQVIGIYSIHGLKVSDSDTTNLPKGVYLYVFSDGTVAKTLIK